MFIYVDICIYICIIYVPFYSYHQKIPPAAPELELKATYGLVSPEEFKVPDPNALWNVEAYKAFEISETAPPEKNEKATVSMEYG